MATNPWQSIWSDGTNGWQNTDTGEVQWGGQQPAWNEYTNYTFDPNMGETGGYVNTLNDLGKQTFSQPAQDQLQMNGLNSQLVQQTASDPWGQAGFVNAGGGNSYTKSLEYGKQFGMDPTQAYQWWLQGQNNTNLFGGATDTGNWALKDAWGAENMLRQSGNWTPDLQNQLNQYVDQGYQDMNARRTQDKNDFNTLNKNFLMGLSALVGGASYLGGGGLSGFGGGTDFVGSDWASGLAGTDNAGLLAGTPGYGGGSMASGLGWDMSMPTNIEQSVLGSGDLMPPNIEGSVLNSAGAPAAGATGGSFSLGGSNPLMSLLKQGGSSVLQSLFGGGGQQAGGSQGAYQFPWFNAGAGLLEYLGQQNYTDKLEQLMNSTMQQTDPFGPNRPFYADKLKQSYTDPAGVFNSPEMQAMNKIFMDKIAAQDAAAGRNSQYGEREVQAQNNFLSNLSQYRKDLLYPSGAMADPGAVGKVGSQFALPLALAEGQKYAPLGVMAQQIAQGQQPSFMQQVAGQQSNKTLGDVLGGWLGQFMNSWA